MHIYLLFPMFALVVLIVIVSIRMVTARRRAVMNKEIDATYFKTYDTTTPPRYLQQISRNYTNQFEVPMLFMVVCLAHLSLRNANEAAIGLAWLFVISRYFHFYIHTGSNKIIIRLQSFALGFVALLGMWINLLIISF